MILEKISPFSYDLTNGYSPESYCMIFNDHKWEVYYSERGHKVDLRKFDTEEEACLCFYSLITDPKSGVVK